MTPEITKTETQRANTDSRLLWYFFAALILFTYFFGLTIPFVGPDEARYAQVAREMLDCGDWITPTLGGFNWFEKPPLLYWQAMIFYKAFGVNEFAARFGPALFGLGTIASLWILGKKLAAERAESFSETSQPSSKISVSSVAGSFANWLALIAASTLGIMVFSHAASFDIVITFPITAALVSFYIWHSKYEIGSQRPGVSASLLLFYIFTGFALLAKGLIGIVFPFAIVGIFYLLSRRVPSRMFLISLIWGTLLAVAITSVWYLPMYMRHGDRFIDEFFIQHHFQRFTTNRYQHPQPFYFFLWVLPLMTLPWLPFFLASIWKFAKEIFHHKATENTENITSLILPDSLSHLLTFSASWLLVPLVFFSFSGSKLPGYILPAVPAAVIFTAGFVYEIVKKSHKWRNAVLLIAASTFAAAILLIIFAMPRYAENDSVKTLIQAANERGFHSNRVLTLHTISHNAEFYAAGRLLRDSDGKQRHLSEIAEVQNEIDAENGRPVLVLVPLEYLSQLTDNEKMKTAVLKDNGELAIVSVSVK